MDNPDVQDVFATVSVLNGKHDEAKQSLWEKIEPVTAVPVPDKFKSNINIASIEDSDTDITQHQIFDLQAQGYTKALAKSISSNKKTFPLRFWVIDNSGSMAKPDGTRFIETVRKGDVKMVTCTRWKEIQETVEYHIQMAALLKAPTMFRFLNTPGSTVGPQEFGVANRINSSDNFQSKNDKFDDYKVTTPFSSIESDVEFALDLIKRARPGGVTPLTEHIYHIREQLTHLMPRLRQEGRKVIIVLATDGLPTDDTGRGTAREKDRFLSALKSLQSWPVWIVIRLCTDDDEVVDFYNNLDADLEKNLEVLDDYTQEAFEVYKYNKWLNYALPLHRMREMGYHNRLFDFIDERPLTKSEIGEFCALLFGIDQFDSMPDPDENFKAFLEELHPIVRREENQWNPVKKKMMPWVDLKKLAKMHGGKSCVVM